MINKQSLWFLTLFSLILILGIYYISIDDEVTSVLSTVDNSTPVIEISESEALVALEVENEEEKQALLEEYQNILLDSASTVEEKNLAYENMQELNNTINMEEKIKNLINETYSLDNVVKINNDTISVVVSSSSHDTKLANNIIRTVQSLYEEEMYITVKFS